MAGSYTYPNEGDDADRHDVLRNKFEIRSGAELRVAEYALTDLRQIELSEGRGPRGSFDADHLKAIHHHIFQDVYEWAGQTRNQRPVIDGERVEPIGSMSKAGQAFLPGSRIEMGLNAALDPIRNIEALKGSSIETFSANAGEVLGELNYVHPFREGNGRTQEAFIQALGAHVGHEVDFSVITKTRMIEASVETFNDPKAPAMRHLIEDAVDPGRREALRIAIGDLAAQDVKPDEFIVRTARSGEIVVGTILAEDSPFPTIITEVGLVVVPKKDIPPTIEADGTVTVPVTSSFEVPVIATTAIAVTASFMPAITQWPQTVEQTVSQVVATHPSVTMFLQDATLHAGHAWKEPESVVAKVQEAIASNPSQAAAILANVEASPQSFGAMAGGKTLFGNPDPERQLALERVPLFTASMRNTIEAAERVEPAIRQTEIAWRDEMATPLPTLSPAAIGVVQDLAQASAMKRTDKEPAHELAVSAMGQEAFSEVKEWRQAVNARMSVPDAVDRIPGLSDEKRAGIVATVATVDTAVREASMTTQRSIIREATIEINTSRGIDIGPGA
ncbi:Fic/DOC family protein [Aureimonas pseudogalii]|uniref:protein adenylyltransferase n=1 Tax=Aureimonas pseudogalii TaxID=1744844 RepID=A0A7W6H812_9HYPH|nr:Fic family protein [Aureimonas pseudogalii]MBB4000118.1 fido (protein-threonine AMPylation protein) [Aureimonas pseudogalii]